jgi:DNA-binding transcriptional ArsR family regulator
MCAFLCNQIWPRPSCVAAVPMRLRIPERYRQSIPCWYKTSRMSKKNANAVFLKNRDTWIRAVVNNPTMAHTTARVGLHIAMRMRSDQQYCWPSIETISNDTGVSMRSVSTALDVLCGSPDKDTGEVGLVYLNRQSRPNVGNIYSLTFPWM